MSLLKNLSSGKFSPGALKDQIKPFLVRHDSTPIHTIFCLDDSGSMQQEWQSVIQAVRAFFQIRRELGSADDIFSCVQFSDTTKVRFEQKGYDAAHATNLKFRNGGTSFAEALSVVGPIVKRSPANLEVVIVFMTDGQSSDTTEVAKRAIESFLEETSSDKGSRIRSFYGVAFKNDVDHSSFENMVEKQLNGQMKRAIDVAQLRQEFCLIAQEPIASHSH